MHEFETYAATFLRDAASRVPEDERASVQALQVWVDLGEHQDEFTSIARMDYVSGAEQLPWDHLMGAVDGRLGVFADLDEDLVGSQLRDAWAQERGLVADEDGGDPSLVWDEELKNWTGGFTEAFAHVLISAALQAHQQGNLRALFGSDVAIYIYDMEDSITSWAWTRAANPPGLLVPGP